MHYEKRTPPSTILSLVLSLMLLVELSGGAWAATGAGGVAASTETDSIKTGFLIPAQCKPEEGVRPEPKGAVDAWPAPHTTACALSPACIESGYGLWVGDRFYRFGERGQKLALAYFETTKRTSYNKVRVTGDFRDPQAVRVEGIVLTD